MTDALLAQLDTQLRRTCRDEDALQETLIKLWTHTGKIHNPLVYARHTYANFRRMAFRTEVAQIRKCVHYGHSLLTRKFPQTPLDRAQARETLDRVNPKWVLHGLGLAPLSNNQRYRLRQEEIVRRGEQVAGYGGKHHA